MNNYYIYRHIREDKNEPFYIGIGKKSKTYNRSLDKRRNSLWKNIVKKSNNKFVVEIILDDLTFEQALEKEKEFIILYGKIINNTGSLANILDFGTGSITGLLSDEQRKRLSERMLNNNYCKGYKMTDEQKIKRSLISKNQKNNLGKKWSDETKKKMSTSHVGNKATKGYIHITNGTDNKLVKSLDFISDDWYRGRTIKNKMNNKKNLINY
jgi:hypothetical protein